MHEQMHTSVTIMIYSFSTKVQNNFRPHCKLVFQIIVLLLILRQFFLNKTIVK